jgi:hypothetical protein
MTVGTCVVVSFCVLLCVLFPPEVRTNQTVKHKCDLFTDYPSRQKKERRRKRWRGHRKRNSEQRREPNSSVRPEAPLR